jgi:hypothetical protein
MQEGTPIIDAIIRSNPTMGAPTTQSEAERYHRTASRIYCNNIFGALNKHRFPVANLLSAARYASAYSTGTQKGSTLILPHGVPDLLRYSRKENMVYSVSGLRSGDQKKIDMKLQGAYEDPSSGVSILIHHPTPTYEHGVAKPNISIESGGLTDESIVASEHVITNNSRGDPTAWLWESEQYNGTAYVPTYVTPANVGARAALDAEAAANRSRRFTGNHFDPLRTPTGRWPEVGGSRTPQNPPQEQTTLADIINGGFVETGNFRQLPSGNVGHWHNAFPTVKRADAGPFFANLAPPQPNAFVQGAIQTGSAFVIPDGGDDTSQNQNENATFMSDALPAADTALRVFRIARVVASSAILAAPGAQTGELLIGYPFTGVSTSHAEERMRIQLRCYLGAALYQPDNVLIMPNVFVEGIPDVIYYVEKAAPAAAIPAQVYQAGQPLPAGVTPAEAMAMMYGNRHPLFDSIACYTHHGSSGSPVNWAQFNGGTYSHPMMFLRHMDEYKWLNAGAQQNPNWFPGLDVERPDDAIERDMNRMARNAGLLQNYMYDDIEQGEMTFWCGGADRAQMMMWRELYASLAVICHEEIAPTPFVGPNTKLAEDTNFIVPGETRTRKRDVLVREMTKFHHRYACAADDAIIAGGGANQPAIPAANTPQWRSGRYEDKTPLFSNTTPAGSRSPVRNPFMNVARCGTILSWLKSEYDAMTPADQEALDTAAAGPSTWANQNPQSLSLSELLNWTQLNEAARAITIAHSNFTAVPAMRGVFNSSNAVAGSGMFFNSQGASISKADVNSLLGEWPEFGVTATTHTGATFNEVTGVQVKANTGEFGELDHPTKYSVLHGAPQAFEGGQVQVGSTTI